MAQAGERKALVREILERKGYDGDYDGDKDKIKQESFRRMALKAKKISKRKLKNNVCI